MATAQKEWKDSQEGSRSSSGMKDSSGWGTRVILLAARRRYDPGRRQTGPDAGPRSLRRGAGDLALRQRLLQGGDAVRRDLRAGQVQLRQVAQAGQVLE